MRRAGLLRLMLLTGLLLGGCAADRSEVSAYLSGWKAVDESSVGLLEEMDSRYPQWVARFGKGRLEKKDVADYESALASWQSTVDAQIKSLENLKVTPLTQELHGRSLELLNVNKQSLDQVLLLVALSQELPKTSSKKGSSELREEFQQTLRTLGASQAKAQEAAGAVKREIGRLCSEYSLDYAELKPETP